MFRVGFASRINLPRPATATPPDVPRWLCLAGQLAINVTALPPDVPRWLGLAVKSHNNPYGCAAPMCRVGSASRLKATTIPTAAPPDVPRWLCLAGHLAIDVTAEPPDVPRWLCLAD